MAFADVLTRNRPGNLVEKQTRHLNIIQRSGRRLAVLIDDLLDATHIEQSKFELMPVRFDLGEMIEDLTESFIPILREKNQKFVINTPETPVELFADQIRLTQVVSNLVTNASKYSGENSEVTIDIRSEDNEVVIAVKDQGIGIEQQDLSHVFGAFFRADNESTRAQSGTGIGLYFCRMIVEYHNGNISAHSEPDQGSTITMRMPLEYVSSTEEEVALVA